MKSFAVNGQAMTPKIQKGYAVVTREWKAGDRIELELPMEPQRVVADSRIKADSGLVALKYGPLVYNVEAADNQNIDQKIGDAPLRTQWRPDLLGGVMVITGKWADGSDLVAIPNYARMNRLACRTNTLEKRKPRIQRRAIRREMTDIPMNPRCGFRLTRKTQKKYRNPELTSSLAGLIVEIDQPEQRTRDGSDRYWPRRLGSETPR